MHGTASFYGRLTPHYHLIYHDWEASMQEQARDLDSLICELWGANTRRILDAACGIGAQALGLARLGYRVVGFDISAEEIERARSEAAQRDLSVAFSIADMREASAHLGDECDVVLACDNAVPHLQTDDEILTAFCEFRKCLRPGGGCIVSVRDYEKASRITQADLAGCLLVGTHRRGHCRWSAAVGSASAS
jgi:2-polyprenyl-3-methyl-5-hydroxy-6-metoxy-1,4-benzoquinol methylase